ncbi:MAG: cysteine desulfurase [Oscillospiraceae bacterium]|jgi:cysteine desulfurase|nr:cysteine desulfurase [Oscillospiraceae bacterium]
MHYLDNAATTKPCPSALRAALSCMETDWANPASLHEAGRTARRRLETARAQVADALATPPETVIFTSGGTESVHLALRGAALAQRRRGRHIVTTALEHPAVLKTLEALGGEGFDVTVLPPVSGRISADALAGALRPDTVLVSVGLVAGEFGTVGPVTEAAARIRALSPDVLIHTDAVQGFLKVESRPHVLGVDMLSLSAHKIGGLKGAGALWRRPGVRLAPAVRGGGQEAGLRAGTEAMPALCAFGAAAEARARTWRADAARMNALKESLTAQLAALPGARLLPGRDAPHILSFSLPGYPGEVMLRFLSDRGVYVSTGSACHRGRRSEGLRALDLPGPVAAGVLRVSLSPESTPADAEALLSGLRAGMASLVHGI